MVQTVPLSKIEILQSPYPGHTVQQHLYYLHNHSRISVPESLLQTLVPVKIITHKRKLYAYENLDELHWLSSLNRDLEVQIIITGKAKSLEDVKQKIFDHYYFKHLSKNNNLDLHAFERRWSKEIGRPEFLSQKQYAELLNCDRTILYRHHQKLIQAEQQIELSSTPDEVPNTFDWEQVTQHIPEL